MAGNVCVEESKIRAAAGGALVVAESCRDDGVVAV
jgi:hypothetical protein